MTGLASIDLCLFGLRALSPSATTLATGNTRARRIEVARATRQALPRFLAEALGPTAHPLRIDRSAGRPTLLPPIANFSVTHCEDLALIAVTEPEAMPGIDCERLDRQLDGAALARRFLHPTLSARILLEGERDGADAARRAFLHHFVCAEALCKAAGTGLAGALGQWVFDAPGSSDLLSVTAGPRSPMQASQWRLGLVEVDDQHVAALAIASAASRAALAFPPIVWRSL